MPKNVYQDAHTLIDGLRKCVYLMESQDSLYEREVEYLRDEKSKLVERASQASEYECCMTRLANEKRGLEKQVEELEHQRHIACERISKLVSEKSELEAENIGLREEAQTHLTLADGYFDIAETWKYQVGEQLAENDVLKIKLSQCEKETTRNRIEADLWKTILEDSLEKIVDKFYIEKPRYETGWWYVHILVSEDYHGEEPDLSSSPIHNTERVFPFWHHDESDFDDAVRYAKEGSIGLD